eukprot:scaffold377919_cov55-Attheya_sp.AAC.6
MHTDREIEKWKGIWCLRPAKGKTVDSSLKKHQVISDLLLHGISMILAGYRRTVGRTWTCASRNASLWFVPKPNQLHAANCATPNTHRGNKRSYYDSPTFDVKGPSTPSGSRTRMVTAAWSSMELALQIAIGTMRATTTTTASFISPELPPARKCHTTYVAGVSSGLPLTSNLDCYVISLDAHSFTPTTNLRLPGTPQQELPVGYWCSVQAPTLGTKNVPTKKGSIFCPLLLCLLGAESGKERGAQFGCDEYVYSRSDPQKVSQCSCMTVNPNVTTLLLSRVTIHSRMVVYRIPLVTKFPDNSISGHANKTRSDLQTDPSGTSPTEHRVRTTCVASTSCATFFADRETDVLVNKKMNGLDELFSKDLSIPDCVKLLSKENDAVFLTITPINQKVCLTHHFNQFGGTRTQPDALYSVLYSALIGFDHQASVVMIEISSLFHGVTIHIPTWDTLKECKSTANLKALVAPAVPEADIENPDDKEEEGGEANFLSTPDIKKIKRCPWQKRPWPMHPHQSKFGCMLGQGDFYGDPKLEGSSPSI